MGNMDNGLTVSKWVLINQPRIPQNSAQIVCPGPSVWDFNEKRLPWASVVRYRHYLAVHFVCMRTSSFHISCLPAKKVASQAAIVNSYIK